MEKPPSLLNDDGTASMATALMMSHHAFRRDLARFAKALGQVVAGDTARLGALHEEWKSYRGALHGHHHIEDTAVFPDIRSRQPSLARTIERLMADHQRIEPLLEAGDQAFASLPNARALGLVTELSALLAQHLSLEEAEVIPFLREAKSFPPPQTEAEAEMYAQGFAWSSHGIAPEVLEQLDVMLPELLRSKLPAARVAFDERCVRVWGSAKAGAARTPIPTEA